VRRLDACLHLLRLLLALAEELPGPLHAIYRVEGGELAAFVAHLGCELKDLRLQVRQIRVIAEVEQSVPHTVELALQLEEAFTIGCVSHLIGPCDIPHRDPELAMRVLQLHHAPVHRDEEA
jgi:hypothetical protein